MSHNKTKHTETVPVGEAEAVQAALAWADSHNDFAPGENNRATRTLAMLVGAAIADTDSRRGWVRFTVEADRG